MSENLMMATVIIAGVLLALMIVVGLPVVLSMRHARRERELEHAERMKSLELGRPLPGEKAELASAPMNKCLGIAIWVPLGALGIAMAATANPMTAATSSEGIWLAAGAVGVAGVICGTILALRIPPRDAGSEPAARAEKPSYDADALDVVSSRG